MRVTFAKNLSTRRIPAYAEERSTSNF